MNKGGATPDGRCHMHGFCNMFKAHPFFQAAFGIGVYAIGTLDGMGNRNSYEYLFAFAEDTRGQGGIVPFHEFLKKIRLGSPHLPKPVKVFISVVFSHGIPPSFTIWCRQTAC